jgi:hemerythrin-like metal-binding protein
VDGSVPDKKGLWRITPDTGSYDVERRYDLGGLGMTSTVAAGRESAAQALAWSDKLSVGIPEIDSDHRVLVELINLVDTSDPVPEAYSVIGTVLAALADYTEYHFAREEAMHRAVNYPGSADHHASHQLLKRQVLHYQGLYQAAPDGIDVHELFGFLQRWLIEHILHEDMLYVPFCADNPVAREAVCSVGLEFFMEDGMDDGDEIF